VTRGGRVAIRDVHDVERFAGLALTDALRAFGATLRRAEWEDAHQELLRVIVELDRRYDPGKGVAFSTYAYRILRLRVVDWYRGRFEQSRGGRRVELIPLDAEADPGGGRGLDTALAAIGGDPAEGRSPDLDRALRDRRGASERLDDPARLRAPQGATRRDPGAAPTRHRKVTPMPKTPATIVARLKIDTSDVDDLVATLEPRIRQVAAEEADKRLLMLLGDVAARLEGDERTAFRSALGAWLLRTGQGA